MEDELSLHSKPLKLFVTALSAENSLPSAADANITPSLSPSRHPTILTQEIFELLSSQAKLVSGVAHRTLIEQTSKAQIGVIDMEEVQTVIPLDFYDLLWADFNGTNDTNIIIDAEEEPRGRSLSPGRPTGREGNIRGDTRKLTSKSRGNSEPDQEGPSSAAQSVERDRRSRSTSLGHRRGKGMPSGRKSKSLRRKGDAAESDAENDNQNGAKLLDVLRSFPPDVQRLLKNLRGPLYGIWTVTHPLQLHPNSYHEMLQAIQDASGISDSKRLEWELDLLRDFDERRMDRFESYLVSCRDNDASDAKRKAVVEKLKLLRKRNDDEKGYRNEYYKDKGRQPHKT